MQERVERRKRAVCDECDETCDLEGECVLGMTKDYVEHFCREVLVSERPGEGLFEFSKALHARRDVIQYHHADVAAFCGIFERYHVQELVMELLVKGNVEMMECIRMLIDVDDSFANAFANKELFDIFTATADVFERYFDVFKRIAPFWAAMWGGDVFEAVFHCRGVVPAASYVDLWRSTIANVELSPELAIAIVQSIPEEKDAKYREKVIRLYTRVLKKANSANVLAVAGAKMIEVLDECIREGKQEMYVFKLLFLCVRMDPAAREYVRRPDVFESVFALVNSSSEAEAVVGLKILDRLLPDIEDVLLEDDHFDILWANIYPAIIAMPSDSMSSCMEMKKTALRFTGHLFEASARFREILVDYNYVAMADIVFDVCELELTTAYLNMLNSIIENLERTRDNQAISALRKHWEHMNEDNLMSAFESINSEGGAAFISRVHEIMNSI